MKEQNHLPIGGSYSLEEEEEIGRRAAAGEPAGRVGAEILARKQAVADRHAPALAARIVAAVKDGATYPEAVAREKAAEAAAAAKPAPPARAAKKED